MKTFLILALISGLVFGAGIGFAAMSHDGEHMGNCFASLMQGVLCPQFFNLIDLLSFHFSVLKEFSSAWIAVVLAAFAWSILAWQKIILTPPAVAPVRSRPHNFSKIPLCENNLISWLSLCEIRDRLR